MFRWYLGLSSRWANAGEPTPAAGLPGVVRAGDGGVQRVGEGVVPGAAARTARWSAVALNLLYGACVVLRRQALRQQGVNLPDECFPLAPLDARRTGIATGLTEAQGQPSRGFEDSDSR